MATTVRDVMKLVEQIAPPRYASHGDPIGLHLGNPHAKVSRILLALDATLAAIEEARKRKCQMIVTHHPRVYRPLATIREDDPLGEIVTAAIRAKVAIFCAHTNLDACPGGINDCLADLCGLGETSPLRISSREPLLKLVTFVPESHAEDVREAICDAGAGQIGAYGECTFRTIGLGTFRGNDGTTPYLGTPGELEVAEEWRIETILPASAKHAVVTALHQTHPYEEVAYDLYPLDLSLESGLGRVGALKRTVTLQTLAKRLKKAVDAPSVQVLGDPKRKLRRLAVWSGGGCPAGAVAKSNVDAIVTGEIGYHDQEILLQAGVTCIILGHGRCEEIILPSLATSLEAGLLGVTTTVFTAGTPAPWSV